MNKNQVNLSLLRQRAEQVLAASDQELREESADWQAKDVQRLVEELRIYQTELEIQNQELLQSQSSLVVTLDKYRSLFDYMPLPALLVDDRGFILENNRMAKELLGLRSASLQHRYTLLQFIEGSNRLQLQSMLKTIQDERVMVMKQARIRSGSCDGVICDIHILHLNENNQPNPHTLLILVDKTLEMELSLKSADLEVAKEMSEAANRAKSAFLSTISHEMRTPLHGIMGMQSLAIKKTHEPQVLSFLEKANEASQQLLSIINDVLEISRIEANRLKLETVAFDLGYIRHQAINTLESLAINKGLTLYYEPNPDLEIRQFRGDPSRILQVLNNLIGNAIKFTSTGEVTITVKEVPCKMNQMVRLHFAIQDTGIGIQLQDQARIFDAFEQVDASVNRRFGGTGLGLALCIKLVEAMNGRVGVESEWQRGSLFWFEIEVQVESEPALDSDPTEKMTVADILRTRHKGAKILVVEDNDLNREIAQLNLEEVGMNVSLALDGLEAIDAVQADQFDLILMDLHMPNLGGIDATHRIRQIPGYADTPIIAMTANAFSEDQVACIRAGMNAYLSKPAPLNLLYQTLLEWLDRKAQSK